MLVSIKHIKYTYNIYSNGSISHIFYYFSSIFNIDEIHHVHFFSKNEINYSSLIKSFSLTCFYFKLFYETLSFFNISLNKNKKLFYNHDLSVLNPSIIYNNIKIIKLINFFKINLSNNIFFNL